MPWYRLDLGKAERVAGEILIELQRYDEALEMLEASHATLIKLVNDDLSDEEFTTELALTMDAIAGLEELRGAAEKSE